MSECHCKTCSAWSRFWSRFVGVVDFFLVIAWLCAPFSEHTFLLLFIGCITMAITAFREGVQHFYDAKEGRKFRLSIGWSIDP